MSLNVSFRKIKSTDALKEHVEEKVEKFHRYITYPMEIHVLLSLEKPYHCAEITCHAEHRQLVAIAKTKDLYESIDAAVNKIVSQLKKEREKHKGRQKAHLTVRGKSLQLAQDVAAVLPHREKKMKLDPTRD